VLVSTTVNGRSVPVEQFAAMMEAGLQEAIEAAIGSAIENELPESADVSYTVQSIVITDQEIQITALIAYAGDVPADGAAVPTVERPRGRRGE